MIFKNTASNEGWCIVTCLNLLPITEHREEKNVLQDQCKHLKSKNIELNKLAEHLSARMSVSNWKIYIDFDLFLKAQYWQPLNIFWSLVIFRLR